MAKIIYADGKYAIESNGVLTPITQIVDGGKTLKLPANDSNRQYFSIANFQKAAVGGELELTYKPSVSVTRNPGTEPRTIKPLEDWLNEEDKAAYLALKEKAQKARDEANTKPPMTELEKKQRAVDRAQAALAALLANSQSTDAEIQVATDNATKAKKGAK